MHLLSEKLVGSHQDIFCLRLLHVCCFWVDSLLQKEKSSKNGFKMQERVLLFPQDSTLKQSHMTPVDSTGSLYNFYDLLSAFEGPGVQGPHHWLPRTPEHKKDVFKAAIWHSHLTTCPWPARSHPSGRPLSWFRRFWTDGPVIREQHHSNAMGLTGMQSSDCMLERYLRLDRYPQNIWQSQWRNAAKHPPNHAFESNTKPPGASQNRRLWHKERQYCVEATVIKRMCLTQSDSNHQNVTVHCAQCISTLVTSLKRIFRLLPGCNCTPTSTEPTPSAPSPSSKDVAMPKGWFPGTSSHSGWTKSGHGHFPSAAPQPSPHLFAHLIPKLSVCLGGIRICDNASSWGCQCDLQSFTWDVISMREWRNFTCWIGPLLELDLTTEKPCRSKVCNSSRKLCLQQPPTAQMNEGTVRKQNIRIISLLKVWFQQSLHGRLPPNMLHLVATNALTHLHSMGMVQEDQVPSATFNQLLLVCNDAKFHRKINNSKSLWIWCRQMAHPIHNPTSCLFFILFSLLILQEQILVLSISSTYSSSNSRLQFWPLSVSCEKLMPCPQVLLVFDLGEAEILVFCFPAVACRCQPT